MKRYKMELCYDGSRYSGWQTQRDQPNVRTIQAELEEAIAGIVGNRVSVLGSGRTDAGVHALYQVASFSAQTLLTGATLTRALNAVLPIDIRVWNVEEASNDFHPLLRIARKRYRYLISDDRPFFPFYRDYVWCSQKKIDLATMQQAASWLVGCHDFKAFETNGSPRQSTVRTVYDLTVRRELGGFPWELAHRTPNVPADSDAKLLPNSRSLNPPGLIVIEIEADGFLYNMVRTIAGTLVLFGKKHFGFESPDMMQAVIQSKDRTRAGPTAPPCGLYMIDVRYEI